jgi:omega-6 fatty acid desaturase (delta-12 desaturase)
MPTPTIGAPWVSFSIRVCRLCSSWWFCFAARGAIPGWCCQSLRRQPCYWSAFLRSSMTAATVPFSLRRRANDFIGRALGVVTLTPYACWRKSHAIHHANSGNLDRRGTGDVRTLTVREYQSLSRWRRLRYQVYRHPVVLFGLGPIFLFLIHHRIPTVGPFRYRKIWGSILGTNAALAAIIMLMLLTVSGRALMLGYLPVILLAASTGIWLFYIQHQSEHAHWATGPDWDFHIAALKGSSFYDLPAVLHWLTGYISFHHIHHVCSKILNYSLRDCFN